jgi:hypothetical protein
VEFAKGSIEGRKRLNQSLSAFKTNPEVYDAALAKLGEDFVRTSRICCNPDCVFSYNNPGQPCRARRVYGRSLSDLCFWCSPDAVSACESTPLGIRRIAMDLRKFSSCPDVLQTALSKLSQDFVADLRVCSLEAERKAMLKEDIVEQAAQERYYLQYREPSLVRGGPKMARVWLTSYQFWAGGTSPGSPFPHVSGSALEKKYLEEKPGQPRCADCGNVYLWRSYVKDWELASWQIAAPQDAHHDLPLRALKRGKMTYGKSWYYFNGKPLSCSLCTVVSCASCNNVFNWGDQFRRDSCPCGGKVIVTCRMGPQRPTVRCPRHYICGLTVWYQSSVCAKRVCPGTVFVRQFERRCNCCGDLNVLVGLEYLSYDDPGEDMEFGRMYPHNQSWNNANRPDNWKWLGGEFQPGRSPEDPRRPSSSEGGCSAENGWRGSRPFAADDKYELPAEYVRTLRECRGMYFPYSLCGQCRRLQGRAIFCIQTVASKGARVANHRARTEYHKEFIEGAVSLLRSHFPNGSPAWPIDAPSLCISQNGKSHFTHNFLGQAFFVCSCRAKPTSLAYSVSVWQYGYNCKFTDKMVFYRCPCLEDKTPGGSNDLEHPPDVLELI